MYASLLAFIPEDHPVYGMQATGWPSGDGPGLFAGVVDRIEEMLPGCNAKWSVGGLVAHAVAAELAGRAGSRRRRCG